MFKNYEVLDQPLVLQCLFHPRSQDPARNLDMAREDFMIPVGEEGDKDVELGASLHFKSLDAPVVLFFHGNGEIVSDYDDLGQAFVRGAGVNFFVVDYRGYGESSGRPGVKTMMGDCHGVLSFLRDLMGQKGMTGPLCVMGRSLGSAPALELAACSEHQLSCLIIESGFAFALPLLRVLGLDPASMGLKEEQGFENLDKMARVDCPSLVIHAQFDHLIPLSDGLALHEACPVSDKFFLEIKGANHNDIFYRGMAPYLEQVKKICYG